MKNQAMSCSTPFGSIFVGSNRLSRFLAFSTACLVAGAASFANAELVTNGSFEHPGAMTSTQFMGIGGGGNAAADSWTVFHNTQGSTNTEHMSYLDALLPPIFPDPSIGGDHVLRVEVSHHGNGIVQVFSPPGTGPLTAIGEAWIFVNSGVVGVGIGNGGATVTTVNSQQTGVWEKLQFMESTSPVNEIIFYAQDGPTEFYVDLVTTSVPEPGSAIMFSMAAASLVFRRRRRS